MKRLKTALLTLWRWMARHAPELLVAVVAASLLPLCYFLAQAATGELRRLLADPRVFFDSLAADLWPALAWLLCVAGSAALAVLVWRSRAHLWAVARKMQGMISATPTAT